MVLFDVINEHILGMRAAAVTQHELFVASTECSVPALGVLPVAHPWLSKWLVKSLESIYTYRRAPACNSLCTFK